MRIDHIEVINLLFEYEPALRFRYAGGTCTGRVTTLVLVHTDTGHTGVGSAYSHPGLATLVIKGQLAAPLRGQMCQRLRPSPSTRTSATIILSLSSVSPTNAMSPWVRTALATPSAPTR